MSSTRPWLEDAGFRKLCDLVASDRLVVLSGAGISIGLPQKKDPSKALPGWKALLDLLFIEFAPRLSKEDREDCETILSLRFPEGQSLAMAASILRRAAPAEFDRHFRQLITPAPGVFSHTHARLEELAPRGIMTFNYDDAHENAYVERRGRRPRVLTPWDREQLAKVLRTGVGERFVLKAHGSIDSTEQLVLTQESYSELIVQTPAYRAFVQNLLANFSLLVLGFGFADPDFDLFIDTIAHQFGSPIRTHVAVMHENERRPDREVVLRRLYGIELLTIQDFAHIPPLLEDAGRTAGPELERALELCLSPVRADRSAGHKQLRRLGPGGRRVAARVLEERLGELDPLADAFAISEIAYSLGVLSPVENKQALMRLIDQAVHADVAGRALSVVREALEPDDLSMLGGWRQRWAQAPLEPDPSGRISVYLDYLDVYVTQRFASDPV